MFWSRWVPSSPVWSHLVPDLEVGDGTKRVATGDARKVITDVDARYYGLEVNDQSLVPGPNPRLGARRFTQWLSQSTARGELRKAA